MAEHSSVDGLTEAQEQHFWEDGFLVEEAVFTASEIQGLIEACTAPEENLWKDAQETMHSMSLTQRHPAFLNLARDPRIVNRLVPLLGSDILLQSSKLAAKPIAKNAGPFGWHQDFAYFPHTNTTLVAVMVMLDDATPENGCMSMVRGSHNMGLLEHHRDGFFTGVCQQPIWDEQPEAIAAITPRAGGISIHHCLTVHGSRANLSGLPRRGIVCEYRAANAYQLAGNVFADNGLLIAGTRDVPVLCASAEWRLPKEKGRCGRGFGEAWHQEGEFAREANGLDQ